MPSATENAVRRFEEALQALEYAVELRITRATGGEDGLAEEVHMLTSDRAALAESLDAAEARVARLEHLNRDVARRLDGAIATIREILQDDEEGA